jgi:hypothetical protein
MNVSTEQQRILLEVLASTDALFSHHRWSASTAAVATAIAERRREFPAAGVPFVASGDAAQRKQAERDLADLQAAGLLVLLTSKSRRSGVRLTAVGDSYTRSLTGGYRLDEVHTLLELIDTVSRDGTNAGFALEADIAGCNYGTKADSIALNTLEAQSLCLHAAGWLTTSSDTLGRIGFAITPARRSRMSDRPIMPEGLPGFDNATSDLYDALLAERLRERDSWKPCEPSGVFIPLGAGSWSRKPATPKKRKAKSR